jgi:NAD(P)H-flavin reductase
MASPMPEAPPLAGRDSDPMIPRIFRVRGKHRELADVVTLVLEPRKDSDWQGFRPGQFNMLYVPPIGEVPVSMSGDPADSTSPVQTIRAVGLVTQALVDLEPGALVGVRGPFGTPWPLKSMEGEDVVVVAGGLGLAPLRPVVQHLIRHREEFGRVTLLYGARSPDDILFRDELQQWRGRLDMDVDVSVDHAPTVWRGPVGVVTTLIETARFDPDDTVGLVCGPPLMMRFASHALTQRGVDSESIYLSLERNMQCAIGLCGHCQLGPDFICKDGPVLPLSRVLPRWASMEI